MTARLEQCIFAPRRVALVGASADGSKVNSRPQRYLRKAGFAGEIVPVNPGRAEIFGDRCFPSLLDVPGDIDHAFLMVPPNKVRDAVEACGVRHVPVATIFTAGFAEIGAAGRAQQDEIVQLARSHGVRLIGPNCLGVIDLHSHLPLTTNAIVEREEMRQGPLGVISQSGSMLGCIMSRALSRGLGFSRLVSVGNESDLGVGELAQLLVNDPHTQVILLFLETFRDPAQLAMAARAAHAVSKPVIAYKLGRSDIGRRMAASHTGAMVGGDDVANAFFEAHGILRVDTLEALFETASLATGRQPPRSRRVTAVTSTGGGAAMVVDRLGLLGNEVAPPSPEVRALLAAQGIDIPDAPLVDLPMGSDTGGRYQAVLSALLDSPANDAVVAVLGSSVRFNPKQVEDRILGATNRSKPLAVFLAPEAPEALQLLQRNGIAAFRTPESCADAVNAFLKWRAPRPFATADPSVAAAATAALSQCAGPVLNEADSYRVFASLGIGVSEARIAHAPGEVAALDGRMAVKILSADIAHKTDLGLVRLNVEGQAALDDAIASLLARAAEAAPSARIDGVLVQPMRRGLAELILGYRHDPEVGPVVVLGIGGVLAELRRSVTLRLAPVSFEDALEMIAALPEAAVLTGYRGLPRGDCTALARAIHGMSLLAMLAGQPISEAEINPLFVLPEGEGVLAVDGLVVRRDATG